MTLKTSVMAEKKCFTITGINVILKYFKIEKIIVHLITILQFYYIFD